MKQKNYKKTLTACYLGFVTQAISANFAPLLFLTFKSTYGITFEKIAMIPLVFYFTQLIVDLAVTRFADQIGYRACVLASQALSAAGIMHANKGYFLPFLPPTKGYCLPMHWRFCPERVRTVWSLPYQHRLSSEFIS